ncbi:MAG: hypothetical protein WCA78_16160 [Rhizomicrobium sp.]
MKMLKSLRLGTNVSAAVLSAVLGMSAATGTLVLTSTPAYAQTTLDSTQLSAIQASLVSSLQSAHCNSVAVEAAISQAIQNAIAIYGRDATAAITSAIMSYAEQAGGCVSSDAIGGGLAMAAAVESATNVSVASTIASTVANEGKSGEILAFQSTATSLGYSNLASIAGSSPTATGTTGGLAGGGLTGGGNLGNSFSGGFSGGGGGGGGGGCLNPSCTKL